MLRMKSDAPLIALVEQYLLRCTVEGKSPSTVRAYRETLGRFLAAIPVVDAASVGPEHIYAYLGRYTGLTLETRHRYFREVRCFFNWLVDAEYIERSPFRGMRNVRVPQRIVRPFSPHEVTRLLTCCNPESSAGRRDRALVLTLLDTGARCSEVVQLDLADLDLEARRVRIRFGKGNKQRVVPFAARCDEALRAYLADRGATAGPLFLASTGHGASLRALHCNQMDSNRCCAGWGARAVSAKSTPTASVTPSRPGRSSTTRVSSTCSTCSVTLRRTWSAATPPHTARNRRRCGTLISRPATRCSPGRASIGPRRPFARWPCAR